MTLLSAVMLTVGQLLGAGMYSVPGAVLSSVGSIGLFLLYWILGPLVMYCRWFCCGNPKYLQGLHRQGGLLVYVEFASWFPDRSGAEVVYLEMAFPRPRYFIPTIFAFSTVLLSYVQLYFTLHRLAFGAKIFSLIKLQRNSPSYFFSSKC